LTKAGEGAGPEREVLPKGQGTSKTLYLPARSRFGKGRAAPQKVTLRFSLKYKKDPHYKVLEAHSPANFMQG